MSFAFQFEAADQQGATAQLAAKFDEMVDANPEFAAAKASLYGAVEAMINALAAPGDAQQISVRVNGQGVVNRPQEDATALASVGMGMVVQLIAA